MLRVAIHAKRRMSGIAAFGHLDIPPAWHGTYAATARGVPTAERHTAESAAALTAAFIDPALDSDAPSAIWNPVALAWESGPTRI